MEGVKRHPVLLYSHSADKIYLLGSNIVCENGITLKAAREYDGRFLLVLTDRVNQTKSYFLNFWYILYFPRNRHYNHTLTFGSFYMDLHI